MKIKFKLMIVLLFFSAAIHTVCAQGITFRSHAGFGHMRSAPKNYNGLVTHFGGRVMLNAADARKYGAEATFFHPRNGENYTAFGIVLENKKWDWFAMSIGTVGYFGFLGTRDNPVGMTTNLGWEPNRPKKFKPVASYRTDIIFYHRITTTHSVSIGFAW